MVAEPQRPTSGLRSLPIGTLFFPILALVFTVAISIFIALQDRERDTDEFWNLSVRYVALHGIGDFKFWCEKERNSDYGGLGPARRADGFVCRWPESKDRLKRLVELFNQGKDHAKVERELEAALNSYFVGRPISQGELQRVRQNFSETIWAVQSVTSEFVTNRPRWSEADPLDGTLNDLVRFIMLGRVASLECLYRLTNLPDSGESTFSNYVFGLWEQQEQLAMLEHRSSLRVCEIAFGSNPRLINSIRYNTEFGEPHRFSFSETPVLLAATRMLPMYLDDKLTMNYLLSELVKKGDETLKELQQRRKFIIGADLISPTEPIPELPYVLVLWIFLLLVPGYYLSSIFALRAIRSKSTEMKDGRWVEFVLLPQTRSQTILNHIVVVGPFVLLATMVACLPSFNFYGVKLNIAQWIPGSPFDFAWSSLAGRRIGIDIYSFLMEDQSPLITAANRYFIFAYLASLLATPVLVWRTYSARKLCIASALARRFTTAEQPLQSASTSTTAVQATAIANDDIETG
jgi:hypothetical protein